MANSRKDMSFGAFVRPVLFGILSGGAVCILLLSLAAVCMTSVDLPNAAVTPIAVAAGCIGALVGGFVAALLLGKYGWLCGIATGAVLFLLILVSGWLLIKSVDGTFAVLKGFLMIIFGMAGGMFGVGRHFGSHSHRSR